MCTIAFFSVHLSVCLSLDTLPGLKRTAWGPHRRTVFGITLRGKKYRSGTTAKPKVVEAEWR